VEIVGVEGHTLDGSGFRELFEPPAIYKLTKAADEISNPEELADRLKNSVRDIATNLLAEERNRLTRVRLLLWHLNRPCERPNVGG